MCFFKFSNRVRIRSIRVDGLEYCGGRPVAPLIDPETGCTAAEMGEIPVRRLITIEPFKLATPECSHLSRELDEEVA
jgi:hypothetical protein